VPEPPTEQITRLLRDCSRGDQQAWDELAPLVYHELHRLARSRMRREKPDHTLQATALVHEAYMRLVDQRSEWKSRSHFFAIAAQMMRRILVDHAKAQRSAKRGAGAPVVPLDEPLTISAHQPFDLVALNDALTGLSKIDPQRSQIVELRFFGGLSNQESAEVLGLSTATVQRQWAGARAWLYHEMTREEQP
jgi:RNA polymerase sigma factor (TIGR02999 family)